MRQGNIYFAYLDCCIRHRCCVGGKW